MGDIADWLMDQEMDADEDCSEWGGRQFSAHPAHCNRCGTVCYWHHTGVRWALMQDGVLHNCNKVQPGEFDDLTKAQP